MSKIFTSEDGKKWEAEETLGQNEDRRLVIIKPVEETQGDSDSHSEPAKPSHNQVDTSYVFSVRDLNDFIADWLNETHSNYATYVEGVKLFKKYLDEHSRLIQEKS